MAVQPQEPPAEATKGLTESSPPAVAPAARCCHVHLQRPTPSARPGPVSRPLGRCRASPSQADVTGSAAAPSLFAFCPVLVPGRVECCLGSSSPSTGGSLLVPLWFGVLWLLWGLEAASLTSSPLSSLRMTETLLRRAPHGPCADFRQAFYLRTCSGLHVTPPSVHSP